MVQNFKYISENKMNIFMIIRNISVMIRKAKKFFIAEKKQLLL